MQTNSLTAMIDQVNKFIRLYYTSLKFLLPIIIIYIKQNYVHKVIVLYLYTRGAKRLGGETSSGGETRGKTTRGKTTRGETGAKRLGGEMVWGRNVPDSKQLLRYLKATEMPLSVDFYNAYP